MLNPFIVELARNALPETVRYVVEALVIVPFVDQKFVAVKLVEEAFNVYVVVATVRFPAKNPLPFTERSWPGVVVPMPTLPVEVNRANSVLTDWKIIDLVPKGFNVISQLLHEPETKLTGPPLDHPICRAAEAS